MVPIVNCLMLYPCLVSGADEPDHKALHKVIETGAVHFLMNRWMPTSTNTWYANPASDHTYQEQCVSQTMRYVAYMRES